MSDEKLQEEAITFLRERYDKLSEETDRARRDLFKAMKEAYKFQPGTVLRSPRGHVAKIVQLIVPSWSEEVQMQGVYKLKGGEWSRVTHRLWQGEWRLATVVTEEGNTQ